MLYEKCPLKGVGRLGLEPGTTPEGFRGCSYYLARKIEIARPGFFFRFRIRSSLRASAID